MRRLVPLVLVACFAVLGSGVVHYLHGRSHEDATTHRDSQCQLCVQLQQPIGETTPSPVLINPPAPAGLVAVWPDLSITASPVERHACRGPPERVDTPNAP